MIQENSNHSNDKIFTCSNITKTPTHAHKHHANGTSMQTTHACTLKMQIPMLHVNIVILNSPNSPLVQNSN